MAVFHLFLCLNHIILAQLIFFNILTYLLFFSQQDNIIVADWGNSRIQIFDSQGSFLTFVNTLACPLYGPQGLAATNDGQIVVADTGNHCYKIYKYLQ